MTLLDVRNLTAEFVTPDGVALRAREGEAKTAYDAYTEEAIERQVFGAPSYVLDGEVFWGQDRLDFVERRLVR